MDADTLPYLVERYPLLITKLYIPRVDTELIARQLLVERLDRAVNRPLVFITASAGWGKTTLVANWARQAGRLPLAGWQGCIWSRDHCSGRRRSTRKP